MADPKPDNGRTARPSMNPTPNPEPATHPPVPPDAPSPRQIWARTCRRLAWVSGTLTVLLAAALCYNSFRLYRGAGNGKLRVVEASGLLQLKSKLRENPKDDALKTEIRQLDQRVREEYFRREQLAGRAGWALLGSAAVLILSLHGARTLSRPRLMVPVIPARREDPARKSATAASAVTGCTLALAGLTLPLVWDVSRQWQAPPVAAAGTAVPDANPATTTALPAPDDFPTAAELAANWPRFRGHDGSGNPALTNLPETWDGPSGRNILWKAPLELPGENSPVVWGSRVFTTGATAKRREVYCHDSATGKPLWQAPVSTPQSAGAEPPEVMEDTGFAAPTVATDGRRVCAIFANGDVAGFTTTGKPLWIRSLGTPENMYGHAASLALWRNILIVVWDQATPDDGKSKILGLDANTGKSVWETPREVANSWTSPLVIEVKGKPQVITSADPWVIAYNPEDGKEIWKAKCMEGDVAPSPVYANDLLYVACDRTCIAAIRPDGSGDVTETHLAWKQEDAGLPDMCSLVCDGPRLYTLVFGILYAFDAHTGKALWEHDTKGKFEASPAFYNGKLHLLSSKGEYISGTADAEGFKETSRNLLGEGVGASPAFMPGRIFLRGDKNLYCIGSGNGG